MAFAEVEGTFSHSGERMFVPVLRQWLKYAVSFAESKTTSFHCSQRLCLHKVGVNMPLLTRF